jgi:hypothetical protein
MAKKRTQMPFYGKREQRHERDINLVQQRMGAAGANAAEIAEAMAYGRTVLQRMIDIRKTKHRAKLGVGARRLSGTKRSAAGPDVFPRKAGEQTAFGDG